MVRVLPQILADVLKVGLDMIAQYLFVLKHVIITETALYLIHAVVRRDGKVSTVPFLYAPKSVKMVAIVLRLIHVNASNFQTK